MNRNTFFWVLFGLVMLIIYGLLDPQYFPFPKCPFRSLTGFMCPGCGSQRAIHQVLHGHFYEAFRLNALLLPAMAYALTGYGLALLHPASWPAIRTNWFGIRAAWISLFIILIFWIARNLV